MFIQDSRRSYRAYSYARLILITDLFSVGTPVRVTELILMQDLYLYGSTCKYYKTYTGLSDLIRVLQNLYMAYRTYTGLSEHILILRILSLYEGTHRYNKSELIIIVSHTGSDQTYTDTYQVWPIVHSRYRS